MSGGTERKMLDRRAVHARGRRAVVICQAAVVFPMVCFADTVLAPTRSNPTVPPGATHAVASPMDTTTTTRLARDETAGDVAAKTPAAPSSIMTASGRTITPRRASEPASTEPGDRAAKPTPPGDKTSGGKLIEELHKRGIHEGIGAFEPPGTSPPLVGLEVPEGFELPEGYVRHFQTTDDGRQLRPILMFSPDYEFFDDGGQPIAIPQNRIVPAELAPAGLPIRTINIPHTRKPGDLSR